MSQEDHKESMPVFRLKPTGTGGAQCRYLGYVEKGEKIVDEGIELDHNAYAIDIGKFGRYEVIYNAYKCNIPGSYLLKNKKLPVCYTSVVYASQLVGGGLFTLYIYFTISEKDLETLVLPQQYVNRQLYGNYTMELVADDGFLTDLIKKRTPEIKEELMEKYIDKFDENNEENNTKLLEQIEKETENKINEYRKFFEITELSFPGKSTLFKKSKDMFTSKLFEDLVWHALSMREKERREKYCPDMDFKPPKNIISLKDIKEHPEKIDEYVKNICESDSDNE